ncbi:hypothetical protein JCM10450v2_004484 [Rhodotorula kratochvilovae]
MAPPPRAFVYKLTEHAISRGFPVEFRRLPAPKPGAGASLGARCAAPGCGFALNVHPALNTAAQRAVVVRAETAHTHVLALEGPQGAALKKQLSARREALCERAREELASCKRGWDDACCAPDDAERRDDPEHCVLQQEVVLKDVKAVLGRKEAEKVRDEARKAGILLEKVDSEEEDSSIHTSRSGLKRIWHTPSPESSRSPSPQHAEFSRSPSLHGPPPPPKENLRKKPAKKVAFSQAEPPGPPARRTAAKGKGKERACEVIDLTESDAEDIKPDVEALEQLELRTFLSTLSPVYDFARYAPLFARPSIALSTPAQLLSLAGSSGRGMDVLLEELVRGEGGMPLVWKEPLREALLARVAQEGGFALEEISLLCDHSEASVRVGALKAKKEATDAQVKMGNKQRDIAHLEHKDTESKDAESV